MCDGMQVIADVTQHRCLQGVLFVLSQAHTLSYSVLLCVFHPVRALHVEQVSQQLTPHTHMLHTLT